MASTYLSRTQTAGNQKTWTFSAWVKRSIIAENCVFSVDDGSDFLVGRFNSGSIWEHREYDGSEKVRFKTTAIYTDTTAWMHIVEKCDTTQSVEADRFKIFINGVDQSPYYNTDTYPAEDQLTRIGWNGTTMRIGADDGAANALDGYLAQVVLTDGYAYDATTFGSFDATTGEWKPKSDGEIRSGVTFGTNGFLLPFSNASYLGYDYQTSDRSGTTNDFTVSGSGYKAQDNPSNNFCTLNANFASTGASSSVAKTTTYANLAGYPAGNNGFACTLGATKGKWYWEARPVAAYAMMGIMSGSASALGTYDADYANGFTTYGGNKAIMVGTAGSDLQLMNVTTSDTTWGTALNESTDVLGVAVDLDNNNIYFSVNGVWQNSGVPTSGATGTGAVAITVQTGFPALGEEVWLPAMNTFSGSANVQFNFGQGYFGSTSAGATNADDAGIGVFKYDVPAGFYALCTKNLNTYG